MNVLYTNVQLRPFYPVVKDERLYADRLPWKSETSSSCKKERWGCWKLSLHTKLEYCHIDKASAHRGIRLLKGVLVAHGSKGKCISNPTTFNFTLLYLAFTIAVETCPRHLFSFCLCEGTLTAGHHGIWRCEVMSGHTCCTVDNCSLGAPSLKFAALLWKQT